MNFAGLHFGLLFLEKLPADFGIFKPIASICRLLAILRFKKIVSHVTQINFVQSWKKREVTFSGAKGENIISPTDITMG